MKANIVQGMRGAQRLVREAGPYVLIELVLPGGTLIALLLYLYRKGHLRGLDDVRAAAVGVVRTAGRVFDQLAMVWQAPAEPRSKRAGGTLAGLGPQLLLPGR